MCLLTNHPKAKPILSKTAETVVQVYLWQVYPTFGGSLTLITDNGKELKNELFRKIVLGMKHQF